MNSYKEKGFFMCKAMENLTSWVSVNETTGERRYFIHKILEEANLYTTFQDLKYRQYGIHFKEAMEGIKRGKYLRNGFSFQDLNTILNALTRSIRLKHKGRIAKIKTDKSNLMQVYLKLFEFIQRERVFYV